MTFSILAIRSAYDTPSQLYPQPSDEPDLVQLEAADGDDPEFYAASAMAVMSALGSGNCLARTGKIPTSVVVTNSRIALACSTFDRGGGWGGFGPAGLAVALTANAISSARARRRTRGLMLVGHVRYEWLSQVHARDRYDRFTQNHLQVFLGDPTRTTGPLILTIELEKYAIASAVAVDIVRRAAWFKARSARDAANRERLETYAHQPTYANTEDGTRIYAL